MRAGMWLLQLITDYVAAHGFFGHGTTSVAPHPPCLLDLAPCISFPFLKVKFQLKGHCFDKVEEIQTISQKVVDTLTERDLLGAIQVWQERWKQCITAQEDYLKWEGSQI